MENLNHLSDITKFLTKHKNPEANELRNYYVKCCKELTNDGEFKRIFGTNTMCSHCGSLWDTVNYNKVRLIRGKPIPNSIKKLIKNSDNNQSSVYRKKLVRNSQKNRFNKLMIICSVCKKKNIVTLDKKPERLKIVKAKIVTDKKTSKKKKKRNKDKTAGLSIKFPNDQDFKETKNTKINVDMSRLLNSKEKHRKINNIQTSGNKLKKINISKLKGIINTSTMPSKRSSLHNFLTELG